MAEEESLTRPEPRDEEDAPSAPEGGRDIPVPGEENHSDLWEMPVFGRKSLTRVTVLAIGHPVKFILAGLVLLAVSAKLASGLPIRSSFEELLPSNVPSVRQVKELQRRVGGDGTVLLNIEFPGGAQDLPLAEQLATELGADFQAMGPKTIRAVETNVRPIEAFYEAHWPLFLSVAELKQALTEIDTTVHKLKRKANPFRMNLGDDAAAAPPPEPDSPWLDPKSPTPKERIAARFARYQDGYLTHPDGKSLAVLVRPTGTALGVAEASAIVDRMKEVVDRRSDEITAAHLKVGFGGTFPLFVAEYKAIIQDVASTALLCITLVLGSLVLFYRDVRSTLALGFAIIVAVAVTFGLTRLVIGYLNTQTAFLGSIVVGNGINYGLIYLARVRQLRRSGVGLTEACLNAAPTTAHATLLAALGSSVSFGMLILAHNRGFRHFGFIGGVGMLMCWIFTFLLVPAALSLFERFRPVVPDNYQSSSLKPVPRALARTFRHPAAIAAAFAVLTAASVGVFVTRLPHIIEQNLSNLSNDLRGQRQLVRDNQRANDALGHSTAGAVALMPSWADADAYCEVVRARQKEPRFAAVIDGCDTLSSVVPREGAQKLALVATLAERLTDARLALLRPEQKPRMLAIRAELRAQRNITVQDAPNVLVDRFREKDGTLGNIAVVTAKPEAKLEEGPNLSAFVDAVRQVPVNGKLYDATGENVVFADLIHDIEREGPLTTVGSFIGVFLLVAFFFRKVRVTLELMGSLVVGILLMAGVATAMHVKINFFNFIIFPITFGIAVDYGANVLVRVGDRGGKVLTALAEVGPAVALCSWTSMVGYGSLLVALNRALRSFGRYAILGELTSIASALVLLPALTMLRSRRKSKLASRKVA